MADLGGAKLIEADLSSANLKGAITVENPLTGPARSIHRINS
jgi:hypothetical protein